MKWLHLGFFGECPYSLDINLKCLGVKCHNVFNLVSSNSAKYSSFPRVHMCREGGRKQMCGEIFETNDSRWLLPMRFIIVTSWNCFFLIFCFFKYFLLLFKYSCLHLPPTTPPNPSRLHLPPWILPRFGFVRVSFIHVPWQSFPLSLFEPLPPPLWLLF